MVESDTGKQQQDALVGSKGLDEETRLSEEFLRHSRSADEKTGCVVEDLDILCGREKVCLAHPGNLAFRALIESYRQRYQDAQNKQERMAITKEIVAHVSEKSRFLKFDKEAQIWEQIGPLAARDKVSHALRCAHQKEARNKARKVVRRRSSMSTQSCSSAASLHSEDGTGFFQDIVGPQDTYASLSATPAASTSGTSIVSASPMKKIVVVCPQSSPQCPADTLRGFAQHIGIPPPTFQADSRQAGIQTLDAIFGRIRSLPSLMVNGHSGSIPVVNRSPVISWQNQTNVRLPFPQRPHWPLQPQGPRARLNTAFHGPSPISTQSSLPSTVSISPDFPGSESPPQLMDDLESMLNSAIMEF